jgi:hypothetical protein
VRTQKQYKKSFSDCLTHSEFLKTAFKERWRCTIDNCLKEAVLHECVDKKHRFYCNYHLNRKLGYEGDTHVKKH